MKTTDKSDKQMWIRRGKLTLYAIIAAGIGLLIGLYILAPMQAKSEGYVPAAVSKMPTRLSQFTNQDGQQIVLPVKLAADTDTREQGLNGVGLEALDNTYLLYDQEDVSSWSEDYRVKKIKAPLSFAVMDGQGKVIAIKQVKTSDEEVEVETDHRWVLAMKDGLLDRFGIKVGSKLSPDSIQKSK